jgi:hypothetical protein
LAVQTIVLRTLIAIALIAAKLHRALSGRDTAEPDRCAGNDPIQNDWNGSAKVALISPHSPADADGGPWQRQVRDDGDDISSSMPFGVTAELV